jgi:hypothetical protein
MVTGPFQSGPSTGNSDALKKAIRADDGVYFKAWSQDPQAFVISASTFFDTLRNAKTIRPDMTDFDVLQAKVRTAGLSKGTSPLGQLDMADVTAIASIFKEGYINGMDWNTTLDNKLQSPYAKVGGGPTFSKEISTALKRIDKTDATQRLNDAYFKTFGFYPTNEQIAKFENKYNAEAERQLAKTTRTRNANANADGTSTSATSKEVVSGEGFTQAEYDTFLGKFLADNYKITGKEESGLVKDTIKNLQRVYKDNMLPEPPTNELAAFATDIVRSGDSAIQEQKMTAKITAVRGIAAKLYPGLKDSFDAGTDLITTLNPIVQSANNYLGTSFDKSNPIFSQILNYNDGKTVRVMNANEMKSFFESLPEFNTSDAGRAKGTSIANALRDGLR